MVRLWQVSDGTLLRILPHSDTVKNLSFSPDGSTLVTDTWDGTVRLWMISDGSLLQKYGHSTPTSITDIIFNHNNITGTTLASVCGTAREMLYLREVSNNCRVIKVEGHSNAVSTASFSPDGLTLATGSWDSTINLWHVPDGVLIKTLEEFTYGISNIAFSPDGATLASGSGIPPAAGAGILNVWNVPDSQLNYSISDRGANNVSFSPDGSILASSSTKSEAVTLWRASDGTPLHRLECGYGPKIITFSPDGSTLATATIDNTIHFWRASDGSQLQTIVTPGMPLDFLILRDRSILSVCIEDISPDVRHFMICRGSEKMCPLEGCPDNLYCMGFSPDGALLATGHTDGKVILWQTSDGKQLQVLGGQHEVVRKISFSQDGATLASASDDGTVCLWGVSDSQDTKIAY
jgi:WD40 repeat protein